MPVVRDFNIIIGHPLIGPGCINEFDHSISISGLSDTDSFNTHPFDKIPGSESILLTFPFTIFLLPNCSPLLQPSKK